MRVIGGSARGRHLKSPKSSSIRPTSDLVRGAIFDMLDAAGTDYARVLDLYAGTGALGIEALSRGDGFCDFVEKDAAACRLVEENLTVAGLADRGKVHRMPAEKAEGALEGPFSLVLADPPYADDMALGVLAGLCGSRAVEEGTVLVLEHSKRRDVPEKMGKLGLERTRRHGDTMISVYR